jgi:zinc protease
MLALSDNEHAVMKHSSTVLSALVLGAALLNSTPIASAAAALPKGVTAGQSYGGMYEYRLENGLTVLLYPDASKPRLLVNVTYKVGSKHENYGETGMAHLLEHMMFKGSPGFEAIDTEFSKRGMQNNGSTWMDRTNYFEVMPATADNLAWALGMEASRMTGAYVRKSDLDSEMTVVRNEMEMGETNPFSVSMKSMLAQAFMWHNYGNDSIGARADIENVPIEKLQAFYRTYYQPDNAVLIVAGPLELDKTLALIVEKFSGLKKPRRALPVFYTQEPTQDGERESTIRRVAGTPLLMLGYHAPGGAHPDAVALNVLLRVLADQDTGRLRESLVTAGLATGAQAFSLSFQESSIATFVLSFDKTHDLTRARTLALAEIEAPRPVTQAEFQRAKRAYQNELKSSLDDVSRVGLSLSEYIALGDWRLFFVEREQLAALSLADVNRVAASYLMSSNRTAVNYLPLAAGAAPKRAEIPPPPVLRTQLAALKADTKGAVRAGEQLDLDPAALEPRIARQQLHPGFALATLVKATRNQAVNFNISFKLGDASSLAGNGVALEAAAAMLSRGTKSLARVAFQDALDASEAELGFGFSGQTLQVSGRATAKTLGRTLELAVDALKNPRFDAAEFAAWRKEALTSMDAAETDPQALAGAAIAGASNPYPAGHPLAQLTPAQERMAISALNVETLNRAHAKLVGAGHVVAVFVGEFDAAALSAQLGAKLAPWRATAAYSEIPELANRKVARHTWINTPDQANGMLIAALPLALQDTDTDFANATIANYIFGGSGLDSRVMTRLREKDGVSYGGGTGLGISAKSKASIWQLYAIAAPENLSPSEAALHEELSRFAASGITAAELAKAQTGLIKGKRVAWADDARLVQAIASQQENGRTMAFSAAFEQHIAAATLAGVNAFIKKTVEPNAWGFVLAGDAAKAKAATGAAKK